MRGEAAQHCPRAILRGLADYLRGKKPVRLQHFAIYYIAYHTRIYWLKCHICS